MALMDRVKSSTGGGGAALVTSPPPASSRGSSQPNAFGEFQSGIADVTQGRVSLIILDTLILLLIAFYLWTHRAQGGG